MVAARRILHNIYANFTLMHLLLVHSYVLDCGMKAMEIALFTTKYVYYIDGLV